MNNSGFPCYFQHARCTRSRRRGRTSADARRSARKRLLSSKSFVGVCGANKTAPPVASLRILRALRSAPERYVDGGPRIAQLSEGNGRDGHVEPGTSDLKRI